MKSIQNSINVVLNTLAGKIVDVGSMSDGRAITYDAGTDEYVHTDFPQVTFEALLASGDIGTGVDQVAYGNHTHTGSYVPYTGATTNVNLGNYALKASKLQLDTAASNTLAIGEIGWNAHDMTADLKVPGATLQLNQEQVLPVKNNTGSTLLNGRLVQVTGYDSVNDYYTVIYADNSTENSAYVDLMLTEDIPNGSVGLGTKAGIIHDIDTSAGSLAGVVYLGTNGQFTPTIPVYPNKTVVVGFYGSIHNTTGQILVDLNRASQYNINTITDALELKSMQNVGICQMCPILPNDIVIDATARTLTIATVKGGQTISAANPIRFFTDGNGIVVKHEKSNPVIFPAFTDTTGVWYFYFDGNGNPITTQTTWSDFNIIATVYRFYWNSTLVGNARVVVESFEAHRNDISAGDHAWKHAQGSIYETGLDIIHNAIPSGDPNIDGRNSVISLTTGKCSDDGLDWIVTNNPTPTAYFEQNMGITTAASLTSTNSGLFKIRTNDAAGRLDFFPATAYPFKWNSGNNRPQFVDTNGVATDTPDDTFIVYYLYNLSDRGIGSAIKSVSASTSFTSITDARTHSWETLRAQYSTIKDNEIRPLYKLIYHVKHSNPQPYSALCKYAALREVVDIRKLSTTASVASSGSVIATNVTLAPVGTIGSTNVQAAIAELDGDISLKVNLDQTTPQTIGDTTNRLAKLWSTDIESTNMPTVGGVSLSTTFIQNQNALNQVANARINGTYTSSARNAYYIGSKLMVSDYSWGGLDRNAWLGGATNSKVTGTLTSEGNNNIGIGVNALINTTTGYNNISVGYGSLYSNNTGYYNLAIGVNALASNTSGYSNIGIGYRALEGGGGNDNIGIGNQAGRLGMGGGKNIAIGYQSLEQCTGYSNVGIGYWAQHNAGNCNNNVVIGYNAARGLITGSGNTILGANVVGLAAALTNNIILANGTGAIKAQHDGTNWTLTGNVSISTMSLTTALSANNSYTGTIDTVTVGEAVAFGDVLYLKFSDGKYWKAKADAYTTTPAVVMAMASISANAAGIVLLNGYVRYDSWSFAAANIWLSASTAGAITSTQPSTTGNQIQKIGIALSSTKLIFNPSTDIGEK